MISCGLDLLMCCWFWAAQHLHMSTGSNTFPFKGNFLWPIWFLFLCAGKSTHLAQLMGDQGRGIALDRTHAKAQQIRYRMLCPAALTVTVMLVQASTIFCLSQKKVASDCDTGHSRAFKAAVLCLLKVPE